LQDEKTAKKDFSASDKFKISVVNTQTVDGKADKVSESSQGSFRYTSDAAYIVYKTGDSTNMLKVSSSVITLKRTGEYGSDMRFETGKSNKFMYRTPYGSIEMKLFTKYAVHKLGKDGGTIHLNYVLDTNGDKLYNDILITIER
jgi:uncharacterized beta-barrel protein YwiB (DUF1934 family)